MRKTITICDKCGKDLGEDQRLFFYDTQAFDFCDECYKEMENFKKEIAIARQEWNQKENEIIKKYNIQDVVRTNKM